MKTIQEKEESHAKAIQEKEESHAKAIQEKEELRVLIFGGTRTT